MKLRKDMVWEKIFRYPSLDSRFFITVGSVFVFAGAFYLLIWSKNHIHTFEDHILFLNLLIQLLILILGIFGAYYALRQLVETRFTALEEAGMNEMKRRSYYRAREKWKEAFYIKPEATLLANLCEAALLSSDHETFDRFIQLKDNETLVKNKMLIENKDRIIFAFLSSMRHLFIKNQGEAEKNIEFLVNLMQKEERTKLNWDFSDIESSTLYLDLSGECKTIVYNLIKYLKKDLSDEEKNKFIEGNYVFNETSEI